MMDFAKRRPDESLVVRYEDLISNTNNVLSHIFDFFGEGFSSELVETALKDIEDIGMGDWKTYERASIDKSSTGRSLNLPPEEISRLGTIMNEQLTLCGYEELPIVETVSEEQAERKYQMSLMYQARKASEENESDPSD